MARLSDEEYLGIAAEELLNAGFLLNGPVLADGTRHYCCTSDRPTGNHAAYMAFLDERPMLWMRKYYEPEGPENPKKVKLGQWGPLSPEDSERWKERVAQRREEELKAQREAALAARKRLEKLVPATDGNPYLQARSIPPVRGLYAKDKTLVVTVWSAAGEVDALQYIWFDEAEGRFAKLFTKNAATRGRFFEIDPAEDASETALFCEGIADGISIHLATGCRVFVCFSAGNMRTVAEELIAAGRLSGGQCCFVADNDLSTEAKGKGNPGVEHSIDAARAVGGLFCVPARSGETLPEGGAVKDANDVHRALGLSVLAERLSEVEVPPEPKPGEKPVAGASDAELDMLFPEPDLDAMPAYMTEDVPVAVADGPGQKPDPEPEPLREDAPGQAPYPVEAFGPLAGAVSVLAERCCVHPSVAGGVVLGYLSMLAQRIWNVRSRRYATPLSLFLLMVMDSGEGKSDVERIAGRVIRECEAELREVYRDETRRWRIAMKVHTKALAKLDKDFSNDRMGEDEYRGKLEEMDGREPQAPLGPELTLSDFNLEGLYRSLRDGRPFTAAFTAEAGKLFGSISFSDDNKLKFVSSCSDLWSGDPLDKLRQGEGSSKLVDRRLAMCLMVQPVVAESLFQDALLVQQGYLARFLPTAPAPMRKRFIDEDVSALPEMQEYYDACRALLAKKPLDADKPGEGLALEDMRLDGEALAAYKAFTDEIEDDLDPDGGEKRYEPIRENARRSAEQAVRIAGVLTGAWAPYSEEVLPEAMESGIALARWYLDETLRMNMNSSASPVVRHAEAMLAWLYGKNPTREPLEMTSMSQLRKHGPRPREPEDVRKAVNLLVDHKWLRPAKACEVWMGRDKGTGRDVFVTARNPYRVVMGYGRQD